MCKTASRLSLIAVAMLLLAAQTHAAVTRAAGPTAIYSESRGLVKFDAAYDSVNRVHLVVWGTQLLGPVNGLLLNEAGQPLTQLPFAVSDGPQQSGWARIIYSPEQGKFLVTYVRIVGPQHHQKVARFIRIVNGAPALGPEMILDDWSGDSGTATGIAYSAPAGKFLVTWSHYFNGAFPGAPFLPNTFAVTIDGNGTVSLPQIISNPMDGQSDSEIACDPVNRRCLVIGGAWGTQNGGKSSFWARFIDDATAAPFGPTSGYIVTWGGLMDPGAVIYTPAESSSPAQFLIGVGMGGTIFGLTGAVNVGISLPFTMIKASDPSGADGVGYGFPSLRYNKGTHTTLATTTSWLGLAAVQELDGNGARVTNGFDILPDTPESAAKPFDTRNQFAVGSMNTVTPGFLVLEDHYFKAIRATVYNGAAAIPVPPTMISNPANLAARLGQTVTFSASASGGASVQWQSRAAGAPGFSNIPGATSTSLLVFVAPGEAGKLFRAVFSNTVGTVTSTAASLTVSPTANDIDGDGTSDALVFRPSTGTWWGLGASTNQVLQVPAFGAAADMPLSGDLDGDGMTDMVVWRPSTGAWSWLLSSTHFTSGGSLTFGGLGDMPLLGDFDGDKKADLVVWRPSIGTWFWLTSSSNYNTTGTRQWGIASLGDMPLIGDFDGDGRTDITVWRPLEGTWYWLTSSSNYTVPRNVTFGGLGDQPFLADFDGDGHADIAVYRASTGTWFWLTSAGAFGQRTFGGGGGDMPLLTDVDGDGRADITIFRPFTGEWYWLTSSSGYTRVRLRVFGGLGDSPLR